MQPDAGLQKLPWHFMRLGRRQVSQPGSSSGGGLASCEGRGESQLRGDRKALQCPQLFRGWKCGTAVQTSTSTLFSRRIMEEKEWLGAMGDNGDAAGNYPFDGTSCDHHRLCKTLHVMSHQSQMTVHKRRRTYEEKRESLRCRHVRFRGAEAVWIDSTRATQTLRT